MPKLSPPRPTLSLEPSLNFLDLPAELRNTIYDLVLNGADEEILCPIVWQCSPHKRKYTYSLTQTCRQIRHETLAMWHAGKTLLFALRADNMGTYKQWLQRRPDGVFSSIRRVVLEDYQHAKVRASEAHPFFCRSAIVINLAKATPVGWRRDGRCTFCPARDKAVDRVNAVVRARKAGRGGGGCVLTREKLEEIFEAAAWDVREDQ